MASTFSWVDFSDEDREKMVQIIRQLRQQDTIDELGIGSVRDSIANILFPGTTTIQTRAKYMLFEKNRGTVLCLKIPYYH